MPTRNTSARAYGSTTAWNVTSASCISSEGADSIVFSPVVPMKFPMTAMSGLKTFELAAAPPYDRQRALRSTCAGGTGRHFNAAGLCGLWRRRRPSGGCGAAVTARRRGLGTAAEPVQAAESRLRAWLRAPQAARRRNRGWPRTPGAADRVPAESAADPMPAVGHLLVAFARMLKSRATMKTPWWRTGSRP